MRDARLLTDPNIIKVHQGYRALCCGMLASAPAHTSDCGKRQGTGAPEPVRDSDALAELARLQSDFAQFEFFTSSGAGHARRYTARRIGLAPGLHAAVTPDLAELRSILDGAAVDAR